MARKKGEILDANDKGHEFYVQSLNRTFQIIDRIGEAGGKGISATEISQGINLHVSTVYRLLQNLLAWNYVAENPRGNFTLGMKILQLGFLVQKNIEVRSIARKYMEELNKDTKETIYLAILDEQQQDILYIEKIPSRRNVALVSGIGSRNYLHSTANGKCLVSGFSDEKIRAILKEKGMPALTEHTITDIEVFLEEMHKVRELNYAVDDLENEDNVRCIASPIVDYRNYVVAAMSISGVATDIDNETLYFQYKELVVGAARQISAELGYRSPDTSSCAR
jgi:DNA-binding IclR family transcriptional regulator